ncbi:MAG: hypothetical protein QF702_02890 [Prochlorococcaceae cyanobacterium ETNP2_MAG_10]|nr:hypothetical protein [Prochlorococcaceae cyanobacterium ETNP2_MAG_10]
MPAAQKMLWPEGKEGKGRIYTEAVLSQNFQLINLFNLAEDEVLMFTSSYNTNLDLKQSWFVIDLVCIYSMKHQALDIKAVTSKPKAVKAMI